MSPVPSSMALKLNEINDLSPATFIAALADIFEHSSWVAEDVVNLRPFAGIDRLHASMVATVAAASEEQQLALIRAHPDLAGKSATQGQLTASSTSEQAGAGLDSLNSAELAHFTKLNEAYRSRFQFPFIIAVKGLDKYAILQAYEPRLANTRSDEVRTALEQIAQIALFRLDSLFTTP